MRERRTCQQIVLWTSFSSQVREFFLQFLFFCVILDFEFQKQFNAKVGDGEGAEGS